MRLKEIISEGKIGQFPGSMHRITAPYTAGGPRVTEPGFVKAAKQKKYQRLLAFNDLKTDKEKFEFIYNLKDAKATNKIVFEIPGTAGTKIVDYNPQTGEVKFSVSRGPNVDLYSGNANNFKFLGREKVTSSGVTKYKFMPGDIKDLDPIARQTKTQYKTQKKPFSKPSTLTKLPW
jgi:hypothetical protein